MYYPSLVGGNWGPLGSSHYLTQRWPTITHTDHEEVIPVEPNALFPFEAIWPHRTHSSSYQVVTCDLTAPSHYLSQRWHIMVDAMCHSCLDELHRDDAHPWCQVITWPDADLSPLTLMNSLRSEVIWPHRIHSSSVRVLTHTRTAPSHYLNQCWHIMGDAMCHSCHSEFHREMFEMGSQKIRLKIPHLLLLPYPPDTQSHGVKHANSPRTLMEGTEISDTHVNGIYMWTWVGYKCNIAIFTKAHATLHWTILICVLENTKPCSTREMKKRMLCYQVIIEILRSHSLTILQVHVMCLEMEL